MLIMVELLGNDKPDSDFAVFKMFITFVTSALKPTSKT
jgi:hypothetical protein